MEGEGSAPPKGKAALPKSSRREFRRFKPRKPKETIPQCTVPESDSTVKEIGTSNGEKKKKGPRMCRYWNTSEGCRRGESCPFKHVTMKEKKEEDIPVEEDTVANPVAEVMLPPQVVNGESIERKTVAIPRVMSVSEEGEEQKKLRETEINYFRRRFRGTKVIDGEKENSSPTAVIFTYEITEPDWPFDIRSLRFSLLLSPLHPICVPRIDCPLSENGGLPQPLSRHISTTLQTDIDMRHGENERKKALTLYGKWLIHKMDKSILKLFVDGLRRTKLVFDAEKAGISLVMPAGEKREDNVKDEKINHESPVGCDEGSEEEEENEEMEEEGKKEVENVQSTPKERPSIQMQLSWNDSSGNVATLEAQYVKMVIKCARCGEIREEDCKTDGKKKNERCTKCAIAQSITCLPSIVHSSSSTICLLSTFACRPIDCVLMLCSLKFTCLSCNKQDAVQPLSFGQPHKSWCRECHSLVEFIIGGVKFMGNHGKEEDEEAAKNVPKTRKVRDVRDTQNVSIVEGQPLPKNGTCKHYGKSYRWFRFPCCGRLFPCDTCHEESVKGEHEMKIANRIVCGHCSHEQPFKTNAPCAKCSESTTRRRTQFWEGGKGCRDQKAMSKNDSHKFAESRGKTVSKKKVVDLVDKKKS